MSTLVPPPPDLTLPRVVAALHRIAHAAAAIPIAVGVLTLFGSGFIEAIGFILLGTSLMLIVHRERGRDAHRIARILAIAVLAITITTIAGQFLFSTANRMAPNSALNFLLLGSALLLLDRPLRRVHWPAQFLALITAMIALLALMGYAYNVRFFYGIGSYVPMALPTAITFFVLAIGILCARPKDGIMTVIASSSTGGTLVRRLLPAVILMPALLGWMRLAGQRARLFDTQVGQWLLIVAIMTVLAVLVGWTAKLLFRSDVDRATSERTLAYHAMHDALTGLPNRLLFIEQLDAAMKSDQAFAVLFVDLDRFKVINDSLGHGIGDQLLIATGKRIASVLNEKEIVARIGGDEFTILLPDVPRVEEAIEIARRIESAFETPITLGPHTAVSAVSIGIAMSAEGDTPIDIIRHADIAMYHAKNRGRARYVVFDQSMDLAAQRRLELESGLRRAIASGELRVYYQPEVEIDSGKVEGMEALVRWEDPQKGLVSPSEFIAVAEESGLILAIGRWVLFEACRQSKEWIDRFKIPLAVSVNLSGRHFAQATLIDEVAGVLEKTGIDPEHLILEITESVAMEGAETTINILRKLKSLGVRLAIDDFGTGFSSLSYLKRFPVDFLKIDKSFVDGVAEDAHDTAIVQAVIALGHALGLKMIAEGIESPEQVEQLRALGSEIGQGYYFGTPLSGGEAARWLEQWR